MTVCIQKVLNVKTTPETNTAVTGSTTPETSTTTVVTPPVTTAVTTTTPNTTTTSTSTSTSSYTPSANSTTTAQNAFPYWGFFVFCMIVLGFFGVLYFVIKKPKLKGLGRKTKRKVSKK
jgi:cobalamin biosynthesis Mg chelatase CobN